MLATLWKVARVLTAVAALLATGVAADERPFLYTGGAVLICGSSSNPDPADGGIGGVCFEPGHIGADSDGRAGIYFTRACLDCPGLVPGHYCQSFVGPEMTPVGGPAVCEFNDADFCDAMELVSGENWDPSAWVYVTALDPLAAACGGPGSHGSSNGVGHTF